MLSDFTRDESGATAIEYGFIVALISIAAIVAMGAAGDSLLLAYDAIADDLTTVASMPQPTPGPPG